MARPNSKTRAKRAAAAQRAAIELVVTGRGGERYDRDERSFRAALPYVGVGNALTINFNGGGRPQ
jgi:hypothetical protein